MQIGINQKATFLCCMTKLSITVYSKQGPPDIYSSEKMIVYKNWAENKKKNANELLIMHQAMSKQVYSHASCFMRLLMGHSGSLSYMLAW